MENHRYSFTDLFQKKVDLDKNNQVQISSIVIPKIQRPYAQGRTDELCTYVRDTFLSEIFEKLTQEKEEILDLNFIYGIIDQDNDDYRLELLDGQQRLTTLFLLYWYITNIELDEKAEENLFVRECLSKFFYETRTSSTVFCQQLASYKVDLKDKSPQTIIRDSKWYFKSFDRDSTICAMLTMLDAIHERYMSQEKRDLFGNLKRLQFYVKSLGLYNLSEELYIKMNARGLQLSPLENFKADLTHFISNEKRGIFKERVPLYKKDANDKVLFSFNFSVKLDTKWVDIFWRKGSEDFDATYMRFFTRFFACKYIITSKNKVSDKEMASDKILKAFYTDSEERIARNEYFGFRDFEQLLETHPECIFTLNRVLDEIHLDECETGKRVIFKTMLPVWDKKPEKDGDDFYCNTSKLSHVKLVALAALIEYVEAMEMIEAANLERWMRVVWNIIENTNIDGITPASSLVRKFSAIIHFVAKQMETGASFYEALSQWHIENRVSENRALVEEIEKAKRIAEDVGWEEIWLQVEKHPYFKGMATFFYTPAMIKEAYAKRTEIAYGMFDGNGISKTYRNKHILIRAIVSQFSTWKELKGLYVTERAETNKYLKNILASNEKVREMFADVTSCSTEIEVKERLKKYIDEAKGPADCTDKHVILAFNRLRKDIKMYDWISEQEHEKSATFRVYWSGGHIMFAVPRAWYAKIALDTERAKMANSLCNDYSFEFDDNNQKLMYDKYGNCFGNYIWVKRKRDNCWIWIYFDQGHQLRIQIECSTQKFAKRLQGRLENAYPCQDKKTIELWYGTKLQTYRKLCKELDKIIEVLCGLEKN